MDFKLKRSDLNFRIYTAASTPSTGIENDIVIISEVPMSNWLMSPDKPTGIPRTDGNVWIQYSVTGNTFNALKNNSMMIATIAAWQFVDGSWVDVTAMSYQNGEWVDFVKWLFNNGSVVPWSIYNESSDCVTIDQKITIDASNGVAAIAYVKMDVSDFTKLKATVKHLGGELSAEHSYGAYIGVNDTVIPQMRQWEATFTSKDKTATDFEVDISHVSGEKYIMFGCYNAKYECTKIWLE